MWLRWLLLLIVLSAPRALLAEPIFLQHRVFDPVNLLSAIPALSAPGTDVFQFQVAASHVNVFAGGFARNGSREEQLIMDGEISELEIRGQWRFRQCYTAAIDTRLISHAGGSLDESISKWHEIFSLPDANRDDNEYDELYYLFSLTGEDDESIPDFSSTQTRFTTTGSSFGDLWLSVQRPLNCNARRGANGHVRIGIKLPLGNTQGWASGGQSALFADWHSLPKSLSKRARVSTTVGVTISGQWDHRFEALAPRSTVGYGGIVFDYRWNQRWQSLLQFDIRSPVFHSDLVELGTWGVQLHLGLRAALSNRQTLEVSFSEDVAIDTAPDIGVRVAFTQRF